MAGGRANRHVNHEDLDVAVPEKDVSRLRELLSERGYRERRRDDT